LIAHPEPLYIKDGRLRAKRRLAPYSFILPGLVIMLLTTFIPAIVTLYIAFTNYSVIHLQDWHFIGFANFEKILLGARQGDLIDVFSWTLIWAFLSTGLAFSLGLFLAMLLNHPRLRERNVYRTILILPWALPATLTILALTGLFSTSFGPLNRFLITIGLSPQPWLTDHFWARITCLIVGIWLGFPFMMAVCLGALQSISNELYDAAKIDGANSWQAFRYITFPLLISATLPLLIAGFALQFNNFNTIFLLTGGGPYYKPGSLAGATDLLGTYMYKMAFSASSSDYGLSAAIGIILFIIVGGLTLLNSRMTGAFREAEV
jgi:arabinogalactan oligomer / maltooligosaccharide transport system permease protein